MLVQIKLSETKCTVKKWNLKNKTHLDILHCLRRKYSISSIEFFPQALLSLLEKQVTWPSPTLALYVPATASRLHSSGIALHISHTSSSCRGTNHCKNSHKNSTYCWEFICVHIRDKRRVLRQNSTTSVDADAN